MAAQYATIDDYEVRTNTDVPPEQEDTVQVRLDDTSALMEMYMGDCADLVQQAYPEILTAICVSQAYAIGATPVGVRSESVGGTSVTYVDGLSTLKLPTAATDLLDELMERVCGQSAELPGVGTVGANWAGPFKPPPVASQWMRDVDVWVI